MRTIAALALVMLPAVLHAKPGPTRTAEGRLTGVEAGDNFWLNWRDAKGRPQSDLCKAKECDAWFRAEKLPAAWRGARVRLTLKPDMAMSGDTPIEPADAVVRIERLK